MNPVIDERERLKGQPGLHALIVGISAYRHLPGDGEPDMPGAFGLRKLTSAALTALKVTRWLIDRGPRLAAPLATCRLLIAASPAEGVAEPGLEEQAAPPSFDEFSAAAKAWRADACSHRDNVTFFYFAGHGLKRMRGDHVLILDNFGDGVGGALNSKAVNINELLEGMAPAKTQAEIARTQLYFFDACRTTPEQFDEYQIMNVGSIWDVDKETVIDDRVRPMLFSAIPGTAAYAGKEGTLFGRALLQALNGGAGVSLDDEGEDGGWGISLYELPKALAYHLEQINRTHGADQNWEMQHVSRGLIIQRLDSPPPVDVTFIVLPPEAAPFTTVRVRTEEKTVIREDVRLEPHPFPDTLPAGRYEIESRIDPGTPLYVGRPRTLDAVPPFKLCRLRVT